MNESALYTYGKNFTSLARRNMLDPVLYREEVIDRVVSILLRRTKNNPILIGKAGVGKTAIVEGLASRIVSNQVPNNLQKCEIISLDLGSIVAGAKYRGAFEERIQQIIHEVKTAGNIIIFIDEIHTLVGAGRVDGGLDAANMLKPMLARGEFTCIGATTDDEYREYIEKDTALERRFSTVWVNEPSPEEALFMIRGLKDRYELHHKLQITDPAVQSAVKFAHRYIHDRFLPDSAIDLLDEAAAKKQSDLTSKPLALRKLEEKIFSLKVEMQVSDTHTNESIQNELTQSEGKARLMQEQWQEERTISKDLHEIKELLEQSRVEETQATREGKWDRAAELKYSNIPKLRKQITELEQKNQGTSSSVTVDDIAKVVENATGIPVSRLVESETQKLLKIEDFLSERVVGQSSAIKRVANAIRRSRTGLADTQRPTGCFLFAGPTGVGKTELCRALAELLFDQPDNLLRIDMSEFSQEHNIARLIGAPPGYAGYGKGGTLTEEIRRHPYRVILFDEIEKAHESVYSLFLQMMDPGHLTDGNGRTIHFKNSIIMMTSNIGSECIGMPDQDNEIISAIRSHFAPEFLNRLDDTVLFNTLNIDHIKQIVPRHFKELEENLKKTWSIKIHYSDRIVDWIADNGYSTNYGARPLKRVFTWGITDQISYMLCSGKIQREDTVMIDYLDGKIQIEVMKSLQ